MGAGGWTVTFARIGESRSLKQIRPAEAPTNRSPGEHTSGNSRIKCEILLKCRAEQGKRAEKARNQA